MATHGASILPKSQWKSPKSLEFSRVVKQKKHQLWLLWSYIRLGCVGCVVYGLFHGVWWVSLYRTGDNPKSQWISPKSLWFGAVPKRSPTADNRSSLLVLVNLCIRVCAVCLYNNNNNNNNNEASRQEFGTYCICEHQRLRRDCAVSPMLSLLTYM